MSYYVLFFTSFVISLYIKFFVNIDCTEEHFPKISEKCLEKFCTEKFPQLREAVNLPKICISASFKKQLYDYTSMIHSITHISMLDCHILICLFRCLLEYFKAFYFNLKKSRPIFFAHYLSIYEWKIISCVVHTALLMERIEPEAA